MAITKRARYEVLRRDGFRCFYCGTRGNETTGDGLTIDHVIPKALGGSDEPENLCAACAECNSGKSSVPADADVVAEVNRAAEAHRAARALALRALEADVEAEAEYTRDAFEAWDRVAPGYAGGSEKGLNSLIGQWFRQGVPFAYIVKAFRASWDGPAGKMQKVAYAGGVVRNLMGDAEDRQRSLAAGDNVVWNDGYDAGFNDGQTFERDRTDMLAQHIDGRHDDGMYAVMSDDRFVPWKQAPRGS